MRAIICLGNPGPEYERTRHNVGFLVADYLSARHGIALTRRRLRSVFGRGRIDDTDVLVVKPQTFMNDSGDAVRRIVQFFKIQQQDLIVAYDDIALELGVLRARPGGSDAGHKGIRSVAQQLGTTDIQRLRLGVGQPPAQTDARAWVLSDFRAAERETVQEMVSVAAEALACWVADGMGATMNRYNG